jgi:hypothetical protein
MPWKKTVLILIALLTTFISLKDFVIRDNKKSEVIWKRNIWADKSGYYSYLPFSIIYGFDAKKISSENVEKTGLGFSIEQDKFKTKYTSGVAILQLPFFLFIHVLLPTKEADGFSFAYDKVLFYSSVFYLILGLFFLFLFIRNYTSDISAFLSLLIILYGSNLYYYTAVASGMSHVYSFFLFSAFVYFSHQFIVIKKNWQLIILAIICGLIVLIRPTNIIFLLVFFIIFYQNHQTWKWKELRTLLIVPKVLVFILIVILVFLPQLLYWKYLTGSFIHYSYDNETFSNLLSPKLLLFWFSPNNGLFTYSPVWILFLIVTIYLAIQRNIWAFFALFLFLTTSYLSASWHIWTFGCGFGSRNLVEYTAVFALPVALFTDKYFLKFPYFNLKKVLIFCILIISIGVNFQLMKKYQGCFFGKNDWDWNYYAHLIRPWKYKFEIKDAEILEANQEKHVLNISNENMDWYSYKTKANIFLTINTNEKNPKAFLKVIAYNISLDKNIEWQVPVYLDYTGDGKFNFKGVTYFPQEAWDAHSIEIYYKNKANTEATLKEFYIDLD